MSTSSYSPDLEGANHIAVHVIQGDRLDRRHRYIGADCGDIGNADVAGNALLVGSGNQIGMMIKSFLFVFLVLEG